MIQVVVRKKNVKLENYDNVNDDGNNSNDDDNSVD